MVLAFIARNTKYFFFWNLKNSNQNLPLPSVGQWPTPFNQQSQHSSQPSAFISWQTYSHILIKKCLKLTVFKQREMASLPPTFVPGFHHEDQVSQLQFRSARISSDQSDPTLLTNHVSPQMVSQIHRTSIQLILTLLSSPLGSYCIVLLTMFRFLDRILTLSTNCKYRSLLYRPIRIFVSLYVTSEYVKSEP